MWGHTLCGDHVVIEADRLIGNNIPCLAQCDIDGSTKSGYKLALWVDFCCDLYRSSCKPRHFERPVGGSRGVSADFGWVIIFSKNTGAGGVGRCVLCVLLCVDDFKNAGI